MWGSGSIGDFFVNRPRTRGKGRLFSLAAAAFACLVVLVPLAAAQTTSTLQGHVTDQQGLAVAGAEVRVSNAALAVDRSTISDSTGFYRIAGLPPGVYAMTVAKTGFSKYEVTSIQATVNRTLDINPTMRVASVETTVSVTGGAPLLETTTSSTGGTITPKQIESMPINGRDYLDLLQLVPGVDINKQNATLRSTNANDPSSDTTTPIMGERSGNAVYLIDGMPNTDEVTGGPGSQFNEDSIMEFQVITAGYKAEFGHGSGGIINVISKSGTNQWHGGVSFFHRNYVLDSSNTTAKNPPFLLRWDPAVEVGGPILKDKIFFFGSAERIRETRQLNFQYPPGTPTFVIADQQQFDNHNQTYDLRLRAKLDELFGHHRFSEQVNWTNTQVTNYLPLSESISTPSQRYNVNARHLMMGFGDTATLGNQSNPFVFNAFFQYRGEPSITEAANPTAGLATTLWSMFGTGTGMTDPLFGNQQITVGGYGSTPTLLDQKYWTSGVSVAKQLGRHSLKFGWDFQRMIVDGDESTLLFNQLFATVSDFQTYGINDAGVYLLQAPAPLTPQAAQIRIRNNYNGLYAQDDIRVFKTLTLNAGLRWDYDSTFPTSGNVSPRLGFAWAVTPKTIVRASGGLFYDHFRLGLARDIPEFGGASLEQLTFFSMPRLFYGNPSVLLALFNALGFGTPCTTENAAFGAALCGPGYLAPGTLNSVVASGHSPIPAGAVVTMTNVQSLTGFTPQQFANAAAAAIGEPAGYFLWDPLGHLATPGTIQPYNLPVTLDPRFKVPYTVGFQVGVERELTPTLVVSADYFNRNMHDILGIRMTNLAFQARINNDRQLIPGTGVAPIEGFGPWYAGKYQGLVLGVRKNMSKHFALQGSYTWTNAWDDVYQYTGQGTAFPSDSFVGIVPVITTPTGTLNGQPCGGTNAAHAITLCNGNPAPVAGQFYNGPMYDRGPSDLALKHTFLISGIVELPWKFEFSSIFRVQSGFHYTRNTNTFIDTDGNGATNGIDHAFGRNTFDAPAYTNLDMRIARQFDLSERVKLHAYFEFFNLFNAANPAAVQVLPGLNPAFGSVTQVLPGREGQIGVRFDF